MQRGKQVNRQVVLKERPLGIPQASHFALHDAAIPEPKEGEILVRNLFLSVEPAMRGWVNAAANYSDPVAIGEVMRAFAAGRVIASRHPGYAEGDLVMGMLGWQDYAVTDGRAIRRKVRETDLPLSLSLGVLGINGVTAYFALNACGDPKQGDTVVVSTAAGAVGSVAGQLARHLGCRAVGIAGGADKTRLCVEEFGYDAALDYHSPQMAEGLATACPDGVDVYFDNTSGRISDTVIPLINRHARIVVCGTASVASWDPWPTGPRIERHLLNKAARMQGFLVWDYEHRYEEAIDVLAPLVRQGKLRYREEILDGIEAAPGSIADLYQGKNMGKRLIRLEDE
ncbi:MULTISPECIES: NADP-dependent oxidoreductase [Achromobacter]|uniref:NADP-dependent oxidoreductase n=1 Tax=Achromobacter spanius TaxID=217203 RepID=A0ABY8GLU6_9BURK|nr:MULTISPECIES: NADP-dependent oxidoreductase [Achromobacter]WAI85102.1 NADP-dependent oxidoreductase [Achromobacter spanius]WEX95184.1 NADP-dependent oxidoreductase [Achromobacter sp. SS2-2022]WFP05645.1 NADP-dependent oxidoreductase [Achromobacter spanius]